MTKIIDKFIYSYSNKNTTIYLVEHPVYILFQAFEADTKIILVNTFFYS